MPVLLPRLADGEPDLAVVYEHPVLPEIAPMALGRTYLFDDAFHAVLPRGHRLARSGAGAGPALSGRGGLGRRPGRRRLVPHRPARLPDGRVRPPVALSSDDYRAVQAFVAAGLGVAVIPGLAVARAAPGVEVRRLRAGAGPADLRRAPR